MASVRISNIDKQSKTVTFDALIGNITKQIIPEAIEILNQSPYENGVITGLNGVDITISKGMSVDTAIQTWEQAQSERSEKLRQEHEAWLQTPEGIAHTKKVEEEKRQHDEFVYHSLNEALNALKEVKPVDLRNGTTSIEEAVTFCQEVLLILQKSSDLSLTPEQQKQYSEALKAIGCVNYNDAHKSYKTATKNNIGALLQEENNIEFPLSAFTQLIDTTPDSFEYGMSKLTDGDLQYSWIGEWLRTQEDAQKAKTETGSQPGA